MTERADTLEEITELRARLAEAEATLAALQQGGADALVTLDGVLAFSGAEKPYQAFFESMNEGGLTLDHRGAILHSNPRFVAMIGTPIEKLRGTSFLNYVLPAHHPQVTALLESKETAACEVWIDSNRTPLPVRLSANTIDTGPVKFCSLVVTDLSERIKAEALLRQAAEVLEDERNRAEASALALAKSEHFINVIANALPSMVAYWDKDLRCHFANRAYLDWFGLAPEKLIGMTLQGLLGERLFALNERYIRPYGAGTPSR